MLSTPNICRFFLIAMLLPALSHASIVNVEFHSFEILSDTTTLNLSPDNIEFSLSFDDENIFHPEFPEFIVEFESFSATFGSASWDLDDLVIQQLQLIDDIWVLFFEAQSSDLATDIFNLAFLPPSDFQHEITVSDYPADGFATIRTTATYSVIPIPASVWLFGSAFAFLGWMRRKTA